MQSSKILLKDGQTVDLVDNRISDSDIESWNNKMDKQTVGNVSEPVYLENGIPKIATGVSTKTDLNNLTDAVNNHTTEIGQIEEDVVGIKSSLTNKKDKQSANTFNGSSTKTVKTITQDVNGELNVEFENIDYPDYKISSSDVSINVSTSEGVTDLTLPNDVVRDSNYVHIDGATEVPLIDGNASAGVSTKYAREDHIHPTDTSREAIANKTTVILGTSDIKYPTDKAVAEFVNSSIATNTANYISNNGVPFISVEQLNAYTGTVTNNDYAFVTGTDSEGNTYYDRYKATVKGSGVTWSLEYRLNNSSFTAAQWSAINSGITSALVAKIHEHGNKAVLDGITSDDVDSWNSKLNVDGSNATNAGITAMMKKVSSGTSYVDDDSTYFGDSNDDHTHIVRRPILNLWNYISGKVETKLGSVGGSDKPIYLENGVPKVCVDGVPYSFYNYGNRVGYGVYVGGNTKLSKSTRCYCTFLVSISSNPDLMLHTYIGSFSFRGDLTNKVLKNELRCLTGAPQYPLRMTVVYNEDGKDSNGNPTYSVGLIVIPERKTDKYSTYRLTRIAHSGFIWDVKNISETDYDNCDTSSGTKSASTVIVSSDAVFNSISKSESKTNGCTLKFGATDGSSKSITVKSVVEADKIDGYHISVGTTVGTDPNTIYIVNAT